MNPPEEIVQQSIDLHRKMIKEYSGVPGVHKERLEEGYQVHKLPCFEAFDERGVDVGQALCIVACGGANYVPRN